MKVPEDNTSARTYSDHLDRQYTITSLLNYRAQIGLRKAPPPNLAGVSPTLADSSNVNDDFADKTISTLAESQPAKAVSAGLPADTAVEQTLATVLPSESLDRPLDEETTLEETKNSKARSGSDCSGDGNWEKLQIKGSDQLTPDPMEAKASEAASEKTAERIVKSIVHKHPAISSKTFKLAIQDAYARFILNLPAEYLKNSIQLCFAIQEAYWWYEDYWYESFMEHLPKLNMREFGFVLFQTCPLLRMHFSPWRFNNLMHKWKRYCQQIPLRGAILLNSTLDKVVMVQGWGRGYWMYPRGKTDESEDDIRCAIREMREELGTDIAQLINEHVYIEVEIDDRPLKLYVIPGILETTPFEPRKRKEISRISWIPVNLLPRGCKRRDSASAGLSSLKFYNVAQFSAALLGWIQLYSEGSRYKEEAQSQTLNSMYTFHSPPEGFNLYLKEKYEEQSRLGAITLERSRSPDAIRANKKILKNALEHQPLEPKPQPLQPYVEESIVYSIPASTPDQVVRQLQHPCLRHPSRSMSPRSTQGEEESPLTPPNQALNETSQMSAPHWSTSAGPNHVAELKFRSILQDLQKFGLHVGESQREESNLHQSSSSVFPRSQTATNIPSAGAGRPSSSCASDSSEFNEEEGPLADKISQLAQAAFDAVNLCRSQLGCSKLPVEGVLNILGLDPS